MVSRLCSQRRYRPNQRLTPPNRALSPDPSLLAPKTKGPLPRPGEEHCTDRHAVRVVESADGATAVDESVGMSVPAARRTRLAWHKTSARARDGRSQTGPPDALRIHVPPAPSAGLSVHVARTVPNQMDTVLPQCTAAYMISSSVASPGVNSSTMRPCRQTRMRSERFITSGKYDEMTITAMPSSARR